MARRLLCLWTVAALITMGTTALGQQGRSELRGRVTDDTGGALPGVNVVVTNQDTGTFRELVTSGDGSFFAAQLIPGVFTISAELAGFRGFQRTDFAIGVGNTLDIDIVLEIGALEETITVSGEAPLVDLTSAEVGGTITSEDLTELPLGNRSYFSAVALLPGIQFRPSSSLGNDSIIANGQHPSTNNVQV
ncbi:MAG: carboxypeptidase-like regulatory domain-containing protein, partial [Acidobacteria bacterium]|nr:carboxypeptidase-like regulatory domain-containing protein [Acidobacteriota bacterium]